MTQQPHILFVLEYFHPHVGGVETLFYSLVRELAQRGYPCTVLTQRFRPDLPAKEQQGNLRIRRIRVPNRYLFTLMGFFAALPLLRRVQLIHTTSYNAALPAFLAALVGRKKILITFHEVWGHLWFSLPGMGKIMRWGHYAFERLLLWLPFRRFVAVSKATAHRLQEAGVAPHRITTIYNGLDYADFPNLEPSRPKPNPVRGFFRYTYFGRPGMSKGLDLLLPAAARLASDYPEGELLLILPHDMPRAIARIRQQIAELDLEHRVCIQQSLPYRELVQTLGQSDWVVIPSYSEGFCFAAAEAAALGLPIVHSDRAALREVVSGYHIPMAQQDVNGLHEALNQAVAGNWAYRPQRTFPLRESVRQYIGLYESLLAPEKVIV